MSQQLLQVATDLYGQALDTQMASTIARLSAIRIQLLAHEVSVLDCIDFTSNPGEVCEGIPGPTEFDFKSADHCITSCASKLCSFAACFRLADELLDGVAAHQAASTIFLEDDLLTDCAIEASDHAATMAPFLFSLSEQIDEREGMPPD